MNILQWLVPWEPSITVTAMTCVVAALYIRGCSRITVSMWSKFAFWSGLVVVYFVSHTKFDYYAEHEFFIHRLQHSVLHHIGPILIILSRPFDAFAAGMPEFFKKAGNMLLDQPIIQVAIDFFINPIFVSASFILLICLWLVPPVHFVAMLDWRLYRVMNWGMLINGVLFWGVALGCIYRSGPLSAGTRIAMMLCIIPPQIIIGAVIFCASHELYPIYTICGRAFNGLSPLADQQTGGLIIWIMGSMMSVIGVLITIRRQFSSYI